MSVESVLKFAREMEPDLGEVVACHLEDIVGIRQEDVAAFFVSGHELMLPFLEGSQSFFIVTLDPACFIKTDRLPTALRSIFMEQAVLYHLKLDRKSTRLNSSHLA